MMRRNLIKNLFAGILTFALLFSTYAVAAAAGGGGGGGGNGGGGSPDPVTLVGAYMTKITDNTSTTGKDINGSVNVDPNPTIKLVFNKNVVSSTVWDNNSNAFSMTDSENNNVLIDVSRIPDEGVNANPDEKRNIFIRPNEPLTLGKTYTITIKSNLAANNTSTLGQKVTISFSVKTDITAPALEINTQDILPVTNEDKVVVSGSTEPGSVIKINDVEVIVDYNGLFSHEVSLSSGLNKIQITSTDSAENTTLVEVEVTYDTIAPVLTIDAPTNNFVTDKDKIIITGTSEQNATVKVNNTIVPLDSNHSFAHEIILAKGNNIITVTSTDALGNTASAVLHVTYQERTSEEVNPIDNNGNDPGKQPDPTDGNNSNTTNTHELPNTATSMYNFLYAGLLLILVGFGLLVYPRIRKFSGISRH
ncbi:Ig-like domain-containing protein [Neobacillus sp. FSL H8-0543]|uniref:Ig-like domain-containing protein n=1 Tax=Neobacillus sp. FSL H8-0543 TaxID=2954672 RepID=UPI0031580C6F